MIRNWALSAAIVMSVSASAFAGTIQEDLASAEKHKSTRPKTRAEGKAWALEGQKLVDAFLKTWGDKASEGDNQLYVARAYTMKIGFSTSIEQFLENHKNAVTHAHAFAKSHADNEEGRKLVASLKRYDRQVKSFKTRMAKQKKRDELKGKAAPEVNADEVLDSKTKITLASLKGKVVIIDFWATWCGPCRKVIPHLVELKKKHGDAGLEILGVTRFYKSGYVPGEGSKRNLDPDAEREVNRKCAKALGINYPILFSARKTFTDYMVSGIPQLVLIDRAGKVRHIQVGAGDHTKLDALIAKCLAEKPGESAPAKETQKKRF
ncbi:MAG: TlpA disulfide reductase family protein [Planctomycetota bacterium]|nr:TlpA disulfide reductase family protein [Planctomycetota bacterium]